MHVHVANSRLVDTVNIEEGGFILRRAHNKTANQVKKRAHIDPSSLRGTHVHAPATVHEIQLPICE